ncbi:MAG TPA: hypothetical protein DCL77_04935 [Prolixibacteraceae bacterium]|nr:hypothetical protein [Prolixibacteraceae bacterium]
MHWIDEILKGLNVISLGCNPWDENDGFSGTQERFNDNVLFDIEPLHFPAGGLLRFGTGCCQIPWVAPMAIYIQPLCGFLQFSAE